MSLLLLLSQICWFHRLIFNKHVIQQTCMEVRSVPFQEPFQNETKGPLERTNVKHGPCRKRARCWEGSNNDEAQAG